MLTYPSMAQAYERHWRYINQITRRFRTLTIIFLVTSAVTACGALSYDDTSQTEFNKRLYGGGGALVSRLEPDADENAVYSVADTQSAGGSLLVGYDLSNRFSVEGNLASIGSAQMNPTGEIGYSVGGISALVYGLNDEWNRHRRQGFSLYGRGGVGFMENSSTDSVPFERLNDFHFVYGAGLEYGFRTGFGVRAEIVSTDSDAQYAQFGLLYRLGKRTRREPIARRIEVPVPQEPAPTLVVTTPTPVIAQPVAAVSDYDQDGVEDQYDQCPNTALSTPVNSVGCDYFNGVIEGVNFETNSDRLTQRATSILSEVASTLSRYPAVRISIEAHTDNQGSARSNLDLSKRRALSVARYLVSVGVAQDRVRPIAYGEARPKTRNQTAEGRAINRRVEFRVLD